MAFLKIRVTKENLKKEADLIKATASDEVFKVIKDKSNLEILKIGLAHFGRSGELLKQVCIHFPRRVDKLPKDLI